MQRRKRYPVHHGRHRKPAKKPFIPRIRPSADGRLKAAFSQIGAPEQVPFQPDPFQTDAVTASLTADVLVTVPTGAGKTWIAETVIQRTLAAGGRCWYASPLKALTNSIYKLFSHRFDGDRVGILTGDRKENTDAPVITGTTEILRNQLYDAMHHGDTLATDVVILDEAHYLGDADRGVVWEEIMIYLPKRIPLILLSATIGNPEQIAGWLETNRGKSCRVIRNARRPVPLFPMFFHPSGALMPLTVKSTKGKTRLYKKVQSFAANKRPPLLAPPRKLPPFADILKVLRKYRLLPAIFFMKSRVDCDQALALAGKQRELPADRQQRIAQRIDALTADIPHAAHHRHRFYLEHYGVGAHHSGHLPVWKMVLETLMTEGLIDAIFATSTVAAGVNFPARTVVFSNSDKFNGIDFLPLTPTEFHQMTGRAGRRGMDRIGFALMLPGKFMDVRTMSKLVNAPPSPVYSQIHINFSMVLNLLLSHTPDQIEDLLARSFAAYQIETAADYLGYGQRHLIEEFENHLQYLAAHGYVEPDGRLTVDGLWASKLRVDHPLLIAEGFRKRLFPIDDPAQLAALMAVFVNERETNDYVDKSLTPASLRQAYFKMRSHLIPFMAEMSQWGFATRPMYFRPAATIYAWCRGGHWEAVRELSEMEEGNLVMLMLRTADNLRHVRALKEEFPEAAESAAAAIDRILREPVVTDLGMG
jgi:superfamily II RNA helicase